MNGITVLKTYEVIADSTWGWSWGGFAIALIGLVIAIGMTYLMIKEKTYSDIIAIIFILFLSVGFSLACFDSAEKVYETRYDIYIHGTINMDEFNKKYRIIAQDGLVYTITENAAN